MNCKICGAGPVVHITNLPLTTSGGEIDCEITRCPACGSYSRSADYSEEKIRSHFNTVIYTIPSFEKQFLESKRLYFKYLLELIKKLTNTPLNGLKCLDFGPAYGHMLDIFKQNGVYVEGVELVDGLRERLNNKGFKIYSSLDDIPRTNTYDIVTFIDSLNYFEDPLQTLQVVKKYLLDSSVLVVRIPNRTPFLNLALKFDRPVTNSLFLDSKHNLSYRGIDAICNRAGYEIVKLVLGEKGKKHIFSGADLKIHLFKKIYGAASNWLCLLLGNKIGKYISPGLLIFLRPVGNTGSQT